MAALVAIVLAACGAGAGSAGSGPSVVASFYPLAEAGSRVGGSDVAVTNLTPPGVEPHDLELSPADLEAIGTADVVLYVGGGFQPAMDDAVRDASGVVLDVLTDAGSLLSAGDERDHAEGTDPHVWLDPGRFADIVTAVGEALAEADPGHADRYRRNASGFGARLERLDGEFARGLSDCRSRVIVTNHAAFGYLAERYHLTQVPISGLAPDAEPSPARLAELEALVRREGITTVFTEALASPRVAETLAREVGVRVATLDPLEGLTDDEIAAGEDYLSVMERNLETLRGALDCA